ncbi:MAG TPA: tyrosine-type recombinase/integrase [Vicinamibacterales bacterium]|jgi:integrase|nr:tyrosine-type recombinase/integrase [Vicinamibacterales bacterium]
MGQLKRRRRIWWIRYYRDGKRYEESSGSERESEARALLQRREGDLRRGVAVTPKVGRVKFEEAAKDVINDYSTNGKRTLDDVTRRIEKHLQPFFGGRQMSAITTTDIRTYIAQRQSETTVSRRAYVFTGRDGSKRHVPARQCTIARVSNGEINRELTTLKRMFVLAIQAGKLLQKPHIPMLREDNVRVGFFEREEFDGVLRRLPEALRPVVTFAYITGWRIDSEVLPLQWRHVDFAAGEVRLDPGTTKNREGRTFPMTAELRALLDRQRAIADNLRQDGRLCPHVFHRNGRSIRSFRAAFRAACREAGYPGRLLHDFRRTAVRNLVRAGIPERVAMQMTGHKTRSVFERYNIVSTGDLQDAARRLDAVSGTRAGATGTISGTIGENAPIRRNA